MQYQSTNDPRLRRSFRAAVLEGLAPDGGLYVPARVPALAPNPRDSGGERAGWELGLELLSPFTAGDLAPAELAAILRAACDFPLPLIEPRPGRFVLELFHGPTLAFKDLGARVLARVMAHFVERPTTILVATSGDTGSAVAHGFRDVPGFEVVLLYPAGRVSRLQEQQLTTAGDHARAFAVAGSFDDCQRMLKQALADAELGAQLALGSANSINLARWLPQMIFYARAADLLGAAPRFGVPSGNLGNLTAGLLAQRMGVPARTFVAATNRNDGLPTFLDTGSYQPRVSVATPSNAMDVGAPSNFARMSWLHPERAALRALLEGVAIDDESTVATIRRVHDECGYLLDPHSAVGWAALDARPGAGPEVLLATAHPAKFGAVVARAIGREPELPVPLAACLDLPGRSIPIAPTLAALRSVLL